MLRSQLYESDDVHKLTNNLWWVYIKKNIRKIYHIWVHIRTYQEINKQQGCIKKADKRIDSVTKDIF